jgi:hypothetical protein
MLNYLFIHTYDFVPEKDPSDVLLLWLVLYVVALPISDGLPPPQQGRHEAHQVLPPLDLTCSRQRCNPEQDSGTSVPLMESPLCPCNES